MLVNRFVFLLVFATNWCQYQGIWMVDLTGYIGIVGGQTALPCNTTPPTPEDGVSLILWYREDTGSPLYTIDARTIPLSRAKHFANEAFGSRISFNITRPLSFLRINPLQERDGGEYRCRVDFRRGRTKNRVLTLKVIVPVSHLEVLDSYGKQILGTAGPYNEETALNLTCRSRGGKPHPAVNWWADTDLVDNSYSVLADGFTANVLTFHRLNPQHLLSVYTCLASNTNLTSPISRSFKIDLNLKPKELRIAKPAGQMVAGQSAEMACQSKGSRPHAYIEWLKNGHLVSHEGDSLSEDGFVTTSFLTLVPTLDDNGKRLSCRATNPQFPDLRLEDGFIMNVHYVPILSLALGANTQSQEITEGSGVFFECNVQANPPIYESGWLFDGAPVGQDTLGVKVDSHFGLTIGNVTRVHRGNYKCWALNAQGRGESELVRLEVQYAPTCKSTERAYYGVAKHQQVVIKCEVDSVPSQVLFRWAFNSTVGESYDLAKDSFRIEGRTSHAKFRPRSSSDFGLLYCWAKNKVGPQAEPCTFFIYPQGPPDPPQNCTVSNLTAHSISVECVAGYSGGSQQSFHLRVYVGSTSGRLLYNLTRADYPLFVVHPLPAGNAFLLVLEAVNSQGKSRGVQLATSTLLVSQWPDQDNLGQVIVNPLMAVFVGLVGALVLVAVAALLVIRVNTENERSSKKSNRADGIEEDGEECLRRGEEVEVEDEEEEEEEYSRAVINCHPSNHPDIVQVPNLEGETIVFEDKTRGWREVPSFYPNIFTKEAEPSLELLQPMGRGGNPGKAAALSMATPMAPILPLAGDDQLLYSYQAN